MIKESNIEMARPVERPDAAAEARATHAALAALHRGCSRDAAEVAGAQFEQGEGMWLSIAARLPDSAIVLNHGFVDAADATMSRAAAIYRAAGVRRFFLSTDRAPQASALEKACLKPARGWRMFRRSASVPLPSLAKQADIRRVQPGSAQGFARIVSDAFDLGDLARPWLETIPSAPRWHVFQAVEGDEVAGTGALYLRDGYAWTDFGATRPESRGRGIQKALLAHRIEFAKSQGCHTILTCTGEAVEGEAQISYRNILALGFEEADLILNFAPA
jgi:GNAT superfamily N-acetyltransferase